MPAIADTTTLGLRRRHGIWRTSYLRLDRLSRSGAVIYESGAARIGKSRRRGAASRVHNASPSLGSPHTSALTNAVEDEALGIPDVTSVSANVREPGGKHLFLRVELAESADIDQVRTPTQNEVVTHLREGVGNPRFPVTIELRPRRQQDATTVTNLKDWDVDRSSPARQ